MLSCRRGDNILVIAVHPDDEALGCGGTLLRHKREGDNVYWCIVTAMTPEGGYSPENIKKREGEIKSVSEFFGTEPISLGFPAATLDSYSKSVLVKSLSSVIQKVRPSCVYLPFRGDVHSDHRVCFDVVWSCCKGFRAPFVKRILMMEVPSETDFAVPSPDSWFIPNVYVDISDFMDEKMKMLSCYPDESGTFPFPRSPENIKALAMTRGAVAGCMYAESFMLIRDFL